jgi:hypothetical protein
MVSPIEPLRLLLLASPAFAGYGDARDGLPTHADRELFFWSNAVRVAPDAFRSDYPCDFDRFAAGEKTPKPPLRFDADLTAAAAYHSNDMRTDGYFDHDSNDGTSWDARIRRYYRGGTIAENIAQGYASPYDAVVRGWMCSSGHRANLMSDRYEDLGVGVSGNYYTQDFGAGAGSTPRATTMGLHLPRVPGAQVQFGVDWSANAPPDELYVVVAGERHDLALSVGTEERGVWAVTVPTGTGCRPYHFVAVLDGQTESFPEEGSYGYGDCAWDDAGAEWLAEQVPEIVDETTPTDTGDPGTTPPPTEPTSSGSGETGDDPAAEADGTGSTPEGCGCDGAGGGAGAAPVLAPILALAWRRRRRR